jgi:hypothetical protein
MDISKFVSKAIFVAKQRSPEIFLGLSIVVGGVAIYQAVKYGQKIERNGTIRNARAALIDLRENPVENSAQIRQDIILDTVRELVVPAIPMVAAAVVSAACAAASYKILNGRYAATAAALTSVTKAFSEYRDRTGGLLAAFPGAVADEDGKGATLPEHSFSEDVNSQLEKDLKELGLPTEKIKINGTGFGFLWDKFSCYYRMDDQAANAFHIQQVETRLNQLLVGRGHVFLNELHDEFDVKRTDIGAVVGWVRDVNHPNSHIVLFPVRTISDFAPSEVMIESNVMGVIFKLI